MPPVSTWLLVAIFHTVIEHHFTSSSNLPPTSHLDRTPPTRWGVVEGEGNAQKQNEKKKGPSNYDTRGNAGGSFRMPRLHLLFFVTNSLCLGCVCWERENILAIWWYFLQKKIKGKKRKGRWRQRALEKNLKSFLDAFRLNFSIGL